MAARKPDPYSITSWEKTWGTAPLKHTEICVGSPTGDLDELAERWALADVFAGWQFVAGVVARVALAVTPAVDRSAARHRCAGWDTCGVIDIDGQSGWEWLAAGGGPSVAICVPSQEAREFRQRIKAVLADINAGLKAPVSEAQELDWRPQQPLLRSVGR